MRFIVLLALCMLSMAASGQKEFAPATPKGIDTGKQLEVEGVEFPILKNPSGKLFVMGISAKTGNPYAIWIGEDTPYDYEGYPVRQTTNGRYFYYKLNPMGYPAARWLDEK